MAVVEEVTEERGDGRVAELVARGNASYVDDEFAAACAAYSQALEAQGCSAKQTAQLYALRAQANLQLEDYVNAVSDANRAIEADPSLDKAYLRKGVACFWLEEYETAKAAFLSGMAISKNPERYRTWIRKCDAEVEDEDMDSIDGKQQELDAAPAPSAAAPQASPTSTQSATPSAVASTSAAVPTHEASPPEVPTKPAAPAPNSKYRHQWYQSPNAVNLSVMAKGMKPDRAHVNITSNSLSVHIKAPGSEDLEYALDLDLCGTVDPAASKIEYLSTKIEILLAKADGMGNWASLEKKAAAVQPSRPHYPSSYAAARKQVKDWDKLETEIKTEEKDEKLEGDAALQKLFRDIYSNADEDTRRAMNKSFQESNGTVLSTNWKEIGTKKVECTPPSGMEVKHYEH